MTPVDSDRKKPIDHEATSAARGEKAFAIFDYAIKVVKVSVVVLGIGIVVIALSGVDMVRADEHEVFRYRMYAAPVVIAGYLLIDYLIGRRRELRAADAATRIDAAKARDQFVLSIDPAADRRSAEAAAAREASMVRPKRGYAVELMALAFVGAGFAAFWHDHMNNEIPNAVAVPATFISAKCVDRTVRRIGGSVSPHMLIGYEFPSQSTSVRVSGMKCLSANCEPESKPPQYMDAEYRTVFYACLSDCQVALPAVVASKAPTTGGLGTKIPMRRCGRGSRPNATSRLTSCSGFPQWSRRVCC